MISVIKLLCFLFLSLAFVACDKGRSSFKKNYQDSKHFIDQPITNETFDEAKSALMFFQLHHAAYFDKGSGQDAARAADQIRDQLIKFGDGLLKKTNGCAAESKPIEASLILKADAILQEVRQKTKPYSQREKPKPGECFAMDIGKEFDKKMSYEKIHIEKVEKVGEKAVLLKRIYEFNTASVKTTWAKDLQSQPAREMAISLFHMGDERIDCPRAESLIQEFTRFAEIMGVCYENIEKLNFISEIMKERMKSRQ